MEEAKRQDAQHALDAKVGPKRFTALQFFVGETVFFFLELVIYLAIATPPLLLCWHVVPALGPLALLLLLAGSWLMALALFLSLLIGLRRLLGTIPAGRFLLSGARAGRWIIADKLVKIFYRSPFSKLVNSLAPLRYLYLRGMGAEITGTLLLGPETKVLEPWLFSAGRNVLLGDGVAISGHKVERHIVTLEKVVLEDDVLVGARAILFPGVRVGKGAVIGANSVVTRGTNIPAGETWAGNPARKQTLFGSR